MIRTLLEVSADTEWDHKRKLEAALVQIGFEPKENGESRSRFLRLLTQALHRLDLNPQKLADGEQLRQSELAVKLNG